jgi:putative sterol carrier protein
MEAERCDFLSEEWVRRVVAAIEHAKLKDEKIRKLASEFSLRVTYVVENLPESLRKKYGNDKVKIYVELDKGKTKRFMVGREVPADDSPDFTVISDYEIAKKIFKEELTVASAFVKRYIRVKPLMRLYANPSFTAKSLTTFNALLQVMGKVPTRFQE